MENSFLVLLLTFLVLASTPADAWTAQVAAVTDGDTIKVLQDDREKKISFLRCSYFFVENAIIYDNIFSHMIAW
jgi:hypothetical protein